MHKPSKFGAWLKRLRQEQGLTQEALAERIGYAAQTIRKIEGGQRRPSYQIAVKLAEALSVAPEDRARFLDLARSAPPDPQDEVPAPTPTPTPPTSNLPTPLTRIIGREQELHSAHQRLIHEDVRLLTLVGPGGTGKTRLCLEVAAGLHAHFADGVIFVNLAPISAVERVAATIADAVGVGEEGGRPRLDRLKEGLRTKQMLLVLDNFEQVIQAAPLIADLLSSCSRVKALVTSRELLSVRGEYVLPVPVLHVPNIKHASVDELLQSAAVQLFIERAVAVRPEIVVTGEYIQAVAALCERLDGLPLAIELAAARSSLFPPKVMLERLIDRAHLLSGGPRDLPARQRTLHNTIAWSYELLSEDEQKLFRRVCLFIGGCTFDAIEAVCAAAGNFELDILEGIASLTHKSLLSQEAPSGQPSRFRMLETIREYGLDQLKRCGEEDATRRAHAAYFLALVVQSEPNLWGGAQEYWLARLAQEHDNLRIALAWHLDQPEGASMALCMAGFLWRFWDVRGHWTEGQQWIDRALAHPGGGALTYRWLALHGAGNLALNLGAYARAKDCYEESLSVTRSIGLRRGIANSLINLSLTHRYLGDGHKAVAMQEEALSIHRELGNPIGVALALHNLAETLVGQADYDRAFALAEESRALYEVLQDQRGIAFATHDLALVAHRRGQHERARVLFEECWAIYTRLEALNDLARTLNDMGELSEAQGEGEAARVQYKESLRLASEQGDRRLQATVLENLGRLTHRMGDGASAVALCSRSLSLRRDLGDEQGAALLLARLGQIAP